MPSVVEELSVIATAVGVVGLSLAVGHVVFPEAFVFVAGVVEVFSEAVGYVVPEIALEVASVFLDVPTPALAPSVGELALEVVSVVVLDGSKASGLAGLCFPDVGAFDSFEVDAFVVSKPGLFVPGEVGELGQPGFDHHV